MEEACDVDHAVQDDVSLERPGRVGGAPQRVPFESQAVEWKLKLNYYKYFFIR